MLALALLSDFVDAVHLGLLMVLRGMNVLLNLPQRGVPQDGRQRWQRHSILRRPGRERVPQIVKDEWNGLALFPARFQNVVVAVLDGRRVKCAVPALAYSAC